jgi:hypothetical protein
VAGDETLAALASRCCSLPVARRHSLEVNAANYPQERTHE